MKPYKDESLFWNGVWRAAGCPEVGELYEINRQAKMQYKYAVRRLKRAAYKGLATNRAAKRRIGYFSRDKEVPW